MTSRIFKFNREECEKLRVRIPRGTDSVLMLVDKENPKSIYNVSINDLTPKEKEQLKSDGFCDIDRLDLSVYGNTTTNLLKSSKAKGFLGQDDTEDEVPNVEEKPIIKKREYPKNRNDGKSR